MSMRGFVVLGFGALERKEEKGKLLDTCSPGLVHVM